MRPTPPGRQRDGKAQSARRGSCRLRLSVRCRAKLCPSARPRGPPPQPRRRPSQVGPGNRRAPAAARDVAAGAGPCPCGRGPHAAWRRRRPPRAGGGPWFFAAGCGPSGQAAARVCVQWAKEAPGGQVYEVGPKDAIHIAPTIRFRDVRLSRDESLGFHALDKELLRVCRQIDRIDFMVPTASLYSYQPELDISLDEPSSGRDPDSDSKPG